MSGGFPADLLFCQQMYNTPNTYKSVLVVIGVEVIVAHAPVPGRMNKLDSITNNFSDQANMADATTARAMAFKQN